MVSIPSNQPQRQDYQLRDRIVSLETENRSLKQLISWERKLFGNPQLSASQKLALWATVPEIEKNPKDANGLAHVNITYISKKIGMSAKITGKNLQQIAEANGITRDTKDYIADDGMRRTNIYFAPTELTTRPHLIAPQQPRNHGGVRKRCQHCGSENIIEQVSVLCVDCGAELHKTHRFLNTASQLDQPEQETESQPLDNLTQVFIQPEEPPDNLTTSEVKPATPPDSFSCAVHLLLDIAGTHGEHIMMSRGEKKYITMSRPLTEKDIIDHLQGRKTIGARLTHADGTTRALCFDADNEATWQTLQEAAKLLLAEGYTPILEPSPANRGGHLWIIFSSHVDAVAVHTAVCTIAPALRNIAEYWPRPGNQKVRLPAGKYISASLDKWCYLLDADSRELSKTGIEAVDVLLSQQTPANILPPRETPAPLEIPARSHTKTLATPNSEKGIDALWQQKYGHTTLWFAWTPQQLAALYNERNNIADQLDLQKNGMAFSPSVQERTPSTAITPDNEGWIDFSARSKQENGKHDGGDSFELYARRIGDTKQNKSLSMSQFSRELVREARAILESAARSGAALPQWIEDIVTDAGRKHYQKLREHTRGVAGFISPPVEPEQEIQTIEVAPPMELLPLEEMDTDLWSRKAQHKAREPQTYAGAYPPPDRATYCCHSLQWLWNGASYQCGVCHPFTE